MFEQASSLDSRPLLSVESLRVYFRQGATLLGAGRELVHAVDDVSFDVRRGETLGLVGESGCGKTTTGRAIVGLERPTEGAIWFDGQDINRLGPRELRTLRRRFQMIFQDSYSSLDPRQRVGDIISEPLRVQGIAYQTREQRALDLLALVGLPAEARSLRPHQFSGGQRQRIGIARALAASPELIVCDEPVSALDVSMQAQIVNLLGKLQDDLDLAYILISHDLAVVRNIADRIAVMYLGKIVELADNDELFTKPPRHPYTIVLLSSVAPSPSSARRGKPVLVSGDPPSPINPPGGCRFHPRCWLRSRLGNPAVCETREPLLDGVSHKAACHFSANIPEMLTPEERTGVTRDSS